MIKHYLLHLTLCCHSSTRERERDAPNRWSFIILLFFFCVFFSVCVREFNFATSHSLYVNAISFVCLPDSLHANMMWTTTEEEKNCVFWQWFYIFLILWHYLLWCDNWNRSHGSFEWTEPSRVALSWVDLCAFA